MTAKASSVASMSFFLRVMRAFAAAGGVPPNELLWWRTDGEYAPVTFFINCNDMFYWATADCEKLTPKNIGELERAIADCRTVDDGHKGRVAIMSAPELFVARLRKMRPQRPWMRKAPVYMRALFDACGPKRDRKDEG